MVGGRERSGSAMVRTGEWMPVGLQGGRRSGHKSGRARAVPRGRPRAHAATARRVGGDGNIPRALPMRMRRSPLGDPTPPRELPMPPPPPPRPRAAAVATEGPVQGQRGRSLPGSGALQLERASRPPAQRGAWKGGCPPAPAVTGSRNPIAAGPTPCDHTTATTA